MPMEFEAARGAAEKVLMVRFPVLMRVILPGLLATGVIYQAVACALSHLPRTAELFWYQVAAYAVFVFLLGALTSTLNNEIYKIYEGRTFWPPLLFEWARAKQQAHLEKLRRAADEAKARGNVTRYSEIWYRLRIYPMNDTGAWEATHPTVLGNLLNGYERYPEDRYGMDSVFYWPRIWLQIDKDKKEEIDSQWSVADGFLTLSAISFFGGTLWILEALAASLGLFSYDIPLQSAIKAVLAGVGWILLGYGLYRLSLPFHRENGEIFKSIFDLYRGKIWDITSLRPEEKETWKATWAYLQYLRLKCPNCGKYNPAAAEKCATCGFGLNGLAGLLALGKFPQ